MLMHHRLAGMVLADGSLVWGKLSRSSRAWPAVVVPASLCGKSNVLPGRVMLCWLAEYKVSQVPLEKVFNFVVDFTRRLSKTGGKRYMQAVHEGIKVSPVLFARRKVCCETWQHPLVEGRVCEGCREELLETLFACSDDGTSPRKIAQQRVLSRQALLHVTVALQVQDPRRQKPVKAAGADHLEQPRNADSAGTKDDLLKKLQQRYLPLSPPYSAPDYSGDPNLHLERPIDESEAYCAVCGGGRDLFVCDNSSCGRCLCSQCLIRLVDENEPEKVSGCFPWHCHLCSQHRVGQLLPRPDGEAQLLVFFRPRRHWSGSALPAVADSRRHGLRVLSLFDGIGTGKLVLDKLGLCVEAYFASEVDTDAIRVSISQHGSSVIHLGRVEELDEEKVRSLCPIDLLIAGSPCNDLSLVNPDRKGLYDPLGTGVLFFEFHRILRMVEQLNQGRYLMWMFENVAAMPRLYRGIISRFLQCEPALLDGRFFSPQARARLFWGNIPGMYASLDPQQVQQSAGLDKILDPLLNRRPAVEKIRTVTTNPNSLRATKNGVLPVLMGGQRDVLWTTELEEVFGFPRHYTDVGNISLGKRRQLLGKAWSVPVICHILRPLRSFFKLRDGGH
ncbi:DNA (cytosine-5)-methyltransferase 3B-like [Haemaphysalis longicornis]